MARRGMTKSCEQCGEAYVATQRLEQSKYCSRRCSAIAGNAKRFPKTTPRRDKVKRYARQASNGGLTLAQQQQLFQPFNRLGQEAGVEEGTGIGLVVSKRLVELMGG